MKQEQQAVNAITWLEALLSGKYKQGKSKMGNEVIGFCCWGLGCKVVGVESSFSQLWNDDFYNHVGFWEQNGHLKAEFYGKSNLAEINDNTKAGFKRIAKFLIRTADLHFNEYVANEITARFRTKK